MQNAKLMEEQAQHEHKDQKVEAKAEAKVEAKPDAKPEVKPDAEPAKVDAKPEEKKREEKAPKEEKELDVLAQKMADLRLDGRQKVLVVMRGAPGSGKSTLAHQLAGEKGVVLSTDDYFMKDGVYVYDRTKIRSAHEWNQKRAITHLQKGTSPLVIDNTNMSAWEPQFYCVKARELDYHVAIAEPDTPWAKNVSELFKRNTHKVPREVIESMIDRFVRLFVCSCSNSNTDTSPTQWSRYSQHVRLVVTKHTSMLLLRACFLFALYFHSCMFHCCCFIGDANSFGLCRFEITISLGERPSRLTPWPCGLFRAITSLITCAVVRGSGSLLTRYSMCCKLNRSRSLSVSSFSRRPMRC